jgi:hypothetical protein
MAGANLAFSKVVATPTPTAWSQAYSAGSLFAALSLESSSQSLETDLNSIGKDIISTLESEFFTLERKDLESIKQAITTTVERVNDQVKVSFVVCYLNDNILYLYAVGGGKAVLKRGEKIGTVLEGEEGKTVKSASGYVQNADIIILQTRQFLRIIAPSTLASTLDRSIPEEIAEELAPHVHDKSEGGASAVILSYKEGTLEVAPELKAAMAQGAAEEAIESGSPKSPAGPPAQASSAVETTEEVESETQIPSPQPETEGEEPTHTPSLETTPEEISEIIRPSSATTPITQSAPVQNPMPERIQASQEATSPFLTDQKPKRFSVGFGGLRTLSRTRKIILLVVVLLIAVTLIVALLAIRNTQNSNRQELFNGIFTQAQEKYDEGVSLKELNASLSQESFGEARDILEKNKDTFSDGSDEDNRIEDLLEKVNSELGGETSEDNNDSPTAKEVNKSESKLLSYQLDNTNATYFTQNEDFVYFLNNEGINQIDKGNNEEDLATKKDWDTAGGIGVFGSNIYVLDKDNGILKFVPSGNNYTNSNYFTGDGPNLSEAVAMAIDGSVYVLFEDGSINKYTRGAEDDFEITGLEKALSSPTRIWTQEDDDHIYVLDRGNSRIVVLNKEGAFVRAYSADIIKNAKDFDVQEANKKVFVLSGSKVYEIALQ